MNDGAATIGPATIGPATIGTATIGTATIDTTIDAAATAAGLSGVVRIDVGADTLFSAAYGLADRAHGIANTPATRFAMASGSKSFTALAAVRLVQDGRLDLATPARELLGDDLPLIPDDVTVEHLMTHRSGIGDYYDEELYPDYNDFELSVPVHTLTTTEAFLPVLDGFPPAFTAGERFTYCNGGFLVLALLIERASGTPYHDLIESLVIEPAGLGDTAFLRTDELPGDAALGYLYPDDHPDRLRTNVLLLPVRGNGDGGAYTTAADVHAFWSALFAGRIVDPAWAERMTAPRSDVPEEGARYGMGFWVHATEPIVVLDGGDAGVSMYSFHDPERQRTHTVLSNTADGADRLGQVLIDAMKAAMKE